MILRRAEVQVLFCILNLLGAMSARCPSITLAKTVIITVPRVACFKACFILFQNK